MAFRLMAVVWLMSTGLHLSGQCMLVPSEVCQNQCGPLFYLVNDPPGTTYAWSISCGTITNDTVANPHTVCFQESGMCTIQVIVNIPFEEPDTCTAFVNVLPESLTLIHVQVCPGDSAFINGLFYTEGSWTDTLFGGASNECDSILLISISSFEPGTDTVTYMGCQGDGYSLIVDGTVYDEANPIGLEVLTDQNGCDSVVFIDMTFLPPVFGEFLYEGCEGDGFMVEIQGTLYDESNPTGIELLLGSNGCDSIVTITCIFHPVTYGFELYTGCTGDGYSVLVDTIRYNESNPSGVDTLLGANGCDSIVTIELIFLPPSYALITYIGCMGDEYSIEILGEIFNENNPAGELVTTAVSGCDSIITIDFQFLDCVDSLVLTGDQLCVSGAVAQYQWYTCDGIPLSDTTQCISVMDSGCICVIVTQGTDLDTICDSYLVCMLTCEIVGGEIPYCEGDSGLLHIVANATVGYTVEWKVVIDSVHSDFYYDMDTLSLSLNDAGSFPVIVNITAGGCVTSCTDTLVVLPALEANLCCDQFVCDTCATLEFELSGTPPWSLIVSDGSSRDTITSIPSSPFLYVVCPPVLTYLEYTLMDVMDSGGYCEGVILDSVAAVFLDLQEEPSIIFHDDMLCAEPQGQLYHWRKCGESEILSTQDCFIPGVPGCYCVTVTHVNGGCSAIACDTLLVSSIRVLEPHLQPQLQYDPGSHSILVYQKDFHLLKDFTLLVLDIQGKQVPIMDLDVIDHNKWRIGLPLHVPSWLFVSIFDRMDVVTRGVFIPSN